MWGAGRGRDTHISVESCVVAHGVDREPCFGWLVLAGGGGVTAHTHIQVAVRFAARERDVLRI